MANKSTRTAKVGLAAGFGDAPGLGDGVVSEVTPPLALGVAGAAGLTVGAGDAWLALEGVGPEVVDPHEHARAPKSNSAARHFMRSPTQRRPRLHSPATNS